MRGTWPAPSYVVPVPRRAGVAAAVVACLAGFCLLPAVASAAGGVAPAPARVRLEVAQTGLYRLTGAELARLSLPLATLAPAHLALSCQGRPVARRLPGLLQGRFTEQEAVLFYGEALDTRYTATNV